MTAVLLLLALSSSAAPAGDAGTAVGRAALPDAGLAAPGCGSILVRVLENARPLEANVELSSGAFSCDGQPLVGKVVSLRANGKAVGVGGQRCGTVESDGDGFTLTWASKRRQYRGTLRAGSDGTRLSLYDEVPVEAYLRGVVGSETLPGAPEALAAQAVVSRTFALASRGRHGGAGYDVCDLTHCQLYRGREDERADADTAVARTAGQVLLVGGVVLRPAFFHASCGGATSSAADVFGEEGLNASTSDSVEGGPPLCAGSPDFNWTWQVERGALAAGLGLVDDGTAFEPLRRDRAGRVLEVRAFGQRLSGNELWARAGRAFGFGAVRSLKVTAEEVERVVRFTGHGLGHGVGLCQAGARAAAERGWPASRILGHYFPDSAVRPQPAP